MALTFEKTCEACPEQYDVFDGDKLVGYVRLRWGHLTVVCPDVGGEVVYSANIGDDGYDGCFENEAQRAFHLEEAEITIKKWLEKKDEEDSFDTGDNATK